MNVYEVKFYTNVKINAEGKLVDDEDEEEGEVKTQGISGVFHVGANEIEEAFLIAADFLNEQTDGEYYISKVKEKEKIHIINWPEHNEECDCVSCRTERAAPEDTLKFSCKCGYEIKVVESGWEEIKCPNCQKVILRDRIIGSNGSYILLDV